METTQFDSFDKLKHFEVLIKNKIMQKIDVKKKKKDNFYFKININSMRKQKCEIQMDKEN